MNRNLLPTLFACTLIFSLGGALPQNAEACTIDDCADAPTTIVVGDPKNDTTEFQFVLPNGSVMMTATVEREGGQEPFPAGGKYDACSLHASGYAEFLEGGWEKQTSLNGIVKALSADMEYIGFERACGLLSGESGTALLASCSGAAYPQCAGDCIRPFECMPKTFPATCKCPNPAGAANCPEPAATCPTTQVCHTESVMGRRCHTTINHLCTVYPEVKRCACDVQP